MIEEKIREQLKGTLDVDRIVPCSRGTINHAYEISAKGENYIFRITRKESDGDLLEPIVACMEHFSHRLPVPAILSHGRTQGFPNGFILMEKCNGSLIIDAPDKVGTGELDSIADAIRTISSTEIRTILTNEPPAWTARASRSQGEYYARFMSMVETTQQVLEENHSRFLSYARIIRDRMWRNTLLSSSEGLLLAHNDLSSENIFIDDGVTGIIDFDSMSPGDPHFDNHYSLIHAMYAGVAMHAVEHGLDKLFSTCDNRIAVASLKKKGVFINEFIALQKLMVLRKRILASPENREAYLCETEQFFSNFISQNKYEAMLDEY